MSFVTTDCKIFRNTSHLILLYLYSEHLFPLLYFYISCTKKAINRKRRTDEGCFIHIATVDRFVLCCSCFLDQWTAKVIWTSFSGELRQASREGEGSLSFGGATLPTQNRHTIQACSSIKHTSQVTKHALPHCTQTYCIPASTGHMHACTHICTRTHTHTHSKARQCKQAWCYQGKSCGAQPISAGCLYLHSHVISSQCNSCDVDLTLHK